jgi:phosphoserine phosphatase RsbU/P
MSTELPGGSHARLLDELQRERRRNEILNRATLELARTLRLEEIVPMLVELLGELIDFDAVGIYLYQRETGLLEWFYGAGYPAGSEERVRLKVGQGAVGWTAAHREPLRIADVTVDPRYLAARPLTRSEMSVPLMAEGELLGIFNLESDRGDAFDDDDLRFLTSFGHHCAIAIQRAWLHNASVEKRRMEEEIGIARRIQLRLLPAESPALAGYDIAAFNHPSQEVSGDVYDFIEPTPGQLGIMIGDVSGKGVPAGIMMATFRASLRAEVRNNYAISVILEKVNRLMCESVEETAFVTAVYCVLDSTRRRLTYSNAGHNPPLLLRADGTAEWLSAGGTVLGMFPTAKYEEIFVDLAPGDRLVFYTDGITEARTADDDMFGVERLEALLRASRAEESARGLCARILEAVRAHSGRLHSEDDLTAVVVRVLADAPAAGETD